MRKIFNKTPFAVGETLSQNPLTGEPVWFVAAKATFNVDFAGILTVAEEQLEVFPAPVFKDDDPASVLLYESDFLPKTKIDLLLNATCYAPNETPAKQLDVSVLVGDWNKTLRVFGKRKWFTSMAVLSKSDPLNFEEMPISYEKAYGGQDPNSIPEKLSFEKRNTVGVSYAQGLGKKTFALDGLLVPNIEYPDTPTKSNPKKNKVAGFGPIPGHWEPRIHYAGSYDDAWKASRFPLLPLDFNPLYYQCAPEDQILEEVKGGETVMLQNLTAPYSFLKFTLPKVDILFQTLMDGEYIDTEGKLTTIIMEPDFPRIIMVWLNQLECRNQGKTIEFTRVTHTMKGVEDTRADSENVVSNGGKELEGLKN